MKCLECHRDLLRLDNAHLLSCCGLTLQEYSIKHHLPLDILLSPDQINLSEPLSSLPRVVKHRSDGALTCLVGLQLAGMLRREGTQSFIEGDIRRLDMLLWCLQRMQEYGFVFRQEYLYRDNSHRVIARNRLKTRSANLEALTDVDALEPRLFPDTLAVLIGFAGELHAGYLFLPLKDTNICMSLVTRLRDQYNISLLQLQGFSQPNRRLLRTQTLADTEELLSLLEGRLLQMPGCKEHFYINGPQATVVKELVFDSAHFITDHPGKCSNLHGGRYAMQVKVTDQINPVTGFVLDYGYLKKVVKHLVIDRLDHQNLNFVSTELAWRSSTELLSIFIWEQLIDYLPGLKEIQIHETDHSYCCYSGPTLESFQSQGNSPLLNHFKDPNLGKSSLRHQLIENISEKIVEIR